MSDTKLKLDEKLIQIRSHIYQYLNKCHLFPADGAQIGLFEQVTSVEQQSVPVLVADAIELLLSEKDDLEPSGAPMPERILFVGDSLQIRVTSPSKDARLLHVGLGVSRCATGNFPIYKVQELGRYNRVGIELVHSLASRKTEIQTVATVAINTIYEWLFDKYLRHFEVEGFHSGSPNFSRKLVDLFKRSFDKEARRHLSLWAFQGGYGSYIIDPANRREMLTIISERMPNNTHLSPLQVLIELEIYKNPFEISSTKQNMGVSGTKEWEFECAPYGSKRPSYPFAEKLAHGVSRLVGDLPLQSEDLIVGLGCDPNKYPSLKSVIAAFTKRLKAEANLLKSPHVGVLTLTAASAASPDSASREEDSAVEKTTPNETHLQRPSVPETAEPAAQPSEKASFFLDGYSCRITSPFRDDKGPDVTLSINRGLVYIAKVLERSKEGGSCSIWELMTLWEMKPNAAPDKVTSRKNLKIQKKTVAALDSQIEEVQAQHMQAQLEHNVEDQENCAAEEAKLKAVKNKLETDLKRMSRGKDDCRNATLSAQDKGAQAVRRMIDYALTRISDQGMPRLAQHLRQGEVTSVRKDRVEYRPPTDEKFVWNVTIKDPMIFQKGLQEPARLERQQPDRGD